MAIPRASLVVTTALTPPARTEPEAANPPRRWRQVGLQLLVTRALGQGLEFAAFVLLARRLGPADFGRLSLAFLAFRHLGLVADWGASIRGVRDTAPESRGSSVHDLVRRRNRVTAVLIPGFDGAWMAAAPSSGMKAPDVRPPAGGRGGPGPARPGGPAPGRSSPGAAAAGPRPVGRRRPPWSIGPRGADREGYLRASTGARN